MERDMCSTKRWPTLKLTENRPYYEVVTKVNSLYCGHPRNRKIVSLTAPRVRNNGKLFQSNVCNLFLPGI